MPIKYLYTLLAIMLSLSVSAQKREAVKGKTSYSFYIDQPKDTSGTKQPLFVFLHGRSLCGNNLERVKRYGVLYAIDRGKKVDGIVVAPQSPGRWNADKVIEVIDYVLTNYPNVDSSRVYVCGMSLGGYGTMEVAGKYPERIAAAVAICGGGTVSDAANLAKVPIYLYHGSADKIVPPSESKKIYNAIKKVSPNAEVDLNIIQGGTHGSVERLFHRSDIYNWMLKHKKNPTS